MLIILTERASVTVGTARAGLEVGDGADERSVDGVGAASREGSTALATENGLKRLVRIQLRHNQEDGLTVPRPHLLVKVTVCVSAFTVAKVVAKATRVAEVNISNSILVRV